MGGVVFYIHLPEKAIDGQGKKGGALQCSPFIYEDIDQALTTSNNPISKYHHIEGRRSVCVCVVQSVTVRPWPLYSS